MPYSPKEDRLDSFLCLHTHPDSSGKITKRRVLKDVEAAKGDSEEAMIIS